MATLEITKENFDQTMDQNETVILDFWASWCGPCRMFGPTFEKVSGQFPGVVFGKVDTEAQQELAAAFQVRSIPTLMVFRQNTLIFEQAGALPESALTELIQKIQTLDMGKIKQEIEASSPQGNIE